MACLNPIVRKIWDVRSNQFVLVSVPCGKCLNCRDAFRKSWAFRIKQTACASEGGFIYDTLTFRPGALPSLDYSEILSDGALYIPPEYCPDGKSSGDIVSISDESLKLLDFYGFKLPYCPRTLVSSWIKQGRDRFYMLHHKAIEEGKLSRLHLRYAAVLEYGPLHSRPHIHIMLFGISYADYVRCFAKQWRGRYGFTKTKFIKGGDRKSAGNIAGYLSKYFVKGDFVSPLVKNGLLPKEWRLLSHGLGVEYLKNPRFDGISRWLSMDKKIFKLCCETPMDSQDQELVTRLICNMNMALDSLPSGDESKLLDCLTCAYDNGYPLTLPRYYRDKLLNANKKSVAYVTLSSYILACNSQRKFAQVCAYCAAQTGRPLLEAQIILYHDDGLYYHWLERFDAFQKEQALVKSQRAQIREHNTFVRNFNRLSNDLILFYDD